MTGSHTTPGLCLVLGACALPRIGQCGLVPRGCSLEKGPAAQCVARCSAHLSCLWGPAKSLPPCVTSWNWRGTQRSTATFLLAVGEPCRASQRASNWLCSALPGCLAIDLAWVGVPTQAPPFCPLQHQAAPTLKLAVLSSPTQGTLQDLGPGALCRLLPHLNGLASVF